jgi:hypothetical protein
MYIRKNCDLIPAGMFGRISDKMKLEKPELAL